MSQGLPRSIPAKNRVMALETQIRSAEYRQAQEFMSRRTQPYSEITPKLFSLEHDVMTPNRDRGFQDIHLFLAGLELALRQRAVRIFDLEWRGNHTTINVHQFGGMEQRIDLDAIINWTVWRGRTGFLLPSTDARPTRWRDWQQQVGAVISHEWTPLASILAIDNEDSRIAPSTRVRRASKCVDLSYLNWTWGGAISGRPWRPGRVHPKRGNLETIVRPVRYMSITDPSPTGAGWIWNSSVLFESANHTGRLYE